MYLLLVTYQSLQYIYSTWCAYCLAKANGLQICWVSLGVPLNASCEELSDLKHIRNDSPSFNEVFGGTPGFNQHYTSIIH